MRKYKSVIFLLLVVIGWSSCKKEDSIPQSPPPNWTVDSVGKYPLSMTAIVKVSKDITPEISESDEMGAFLGEECRGTGTFIETDSTFVFFIMIHGTVADQGKKMSFKYYNSQKSWLYGTEAFLNFTTDGSYGTVDNPEVLKMKQIK